MLVLVLGGTGYLYGGVLRRRSCSSVLQDVLSAWTPQYWKFWLGLFLVVLVLVGRERLASRPLDAGARTAQSTRSARHPVSRATERGALATRGLCKRSAASRRRTTCRSTLAPGARHALIGPNGAGKTTLVNLLTGVLAADARARSCSTATTSPRLPPHRRVRRGLVRTFQINQLFASTDAAARRSRSVVAQQRGLGAQLWRALGRRRARSPTSASDCWRSSTSPT